MAHQNLIAQNEHQIKLLTFINEGRDHLRIVLHNPVQGNLPKDEGQLYQALLPFKKQLKHLKKDQLAIIYPQNQRTNSKLFDITILCDLLITCTNITPPQGGWRIRTPFKNDTSTGADILRIRNARNMLMHATSITKAEFQDQWQNIEIILARLGYDISKVKDLKNGKLNDLELFKISILQSETAILKFNEEINKQGLQKNQADLTLVSRDLVQCSNDVDSVKENVKENSDQIFQHDKVLSKLEKDLEEFRRKEEDIEWNKSRIENLQQQLQLNEENCGKKDSDKNQDIPKVRHMMHTNLDGNIVVILFQVFSNIKVHINKEGVMKELTRGVDFTDKICGKRMIIQIFGKRECPPEMVFIFSDSELKLTVPMTDFPHLYHSTTDGINEVTLATHGYSKILDFMSTLHQYNPQEGYIEYLSSGGSRITRLTIEQWYELCWSYITKFFGLENGGYLRESFQFPPFKKGKKISEIAYLLKNLFMEIMEGIVSVITDYDSAEHLAFLHHPINIASEIGKLHSYDNRILIAYPNPNIFLNVRYTSSSDVCDIQKEINYGERDIKCLLTLNSNLVCGKNVSFVNVVIAPDFRDMDVNTCSNCHIIEKV